MDKQITISVQEYGKMLDDILFLNCLREAGVDNWEGYSYAYSLYNEVHQEMGDDKWKYLM